MGILKADKMYDELYDNDIYDNGDDDGIDYSEVDGYEEDDSGDEIEERAELLKSDGVTTGDCPYCGASNTMHYDGYICFICSECKWSMHEKDYYYWLAGGQIEMDE